MTALRNYLLLFFIFISGKILIAQTNSSKPVFHFDGYAEPYFSYDYNRPEKKDRPPFLFSFHRHNEFNINLAFIRGAITDSNFHCSLALMTGTYSKTNLINEPVGLRNIFEANAGFKLSKKKNLWLDAGIFSSHIGFESAIGKDCWTLTRSIMAENTPYYESGIKLSWITANEKWTYRFLVLNGWQRMQLKTGNSIPAIGTQITFVPDKKITFNSSTYFGHVAADSLGMFRYFHNLYTIWQFHPKLGLIAGFDCGLQKKKRGQSGFTNWLNPIVVIRAEPFSGFAFAVRAEYYADANQTVIFTGTPNGFQTFGFSVNADYKVSEHILLRAEARSMNSKDEIFFRNNLTVKDNFCVTGSVAFSF